MSQAENLVKTLIAAEEHIVVGIDRKITVPESLKRIGVQYDHNIETVTIDCPRFWDEHDLSTMQIYINYMRSDGYMDSFPVTTKRIHNDTVELDWVISGNVTEVTGKLSFLVCVKSADSGGNIITHWSSELSRDMYISEGLDCTEHIVNQYPDVITYLLENMNTGGGGGSSSNDFTDEFKSMLENVDTDSFIPGSSNLITSGAVANSVLNLASHLYEAINNVSIDVDEELSETSTNPVQNKVITEEINMHNYMINSALAILNGMSDGVVYRRDLNCVKEDEMSPDAEIESINNVYINVPGVGVMPHTAKFKDTKARELIANIPMQKIYEVTSTDKETYTITAEDLGNAKFDMLYAYVKVNPDSAITLPESTSKNWFLYVNNKGTKQCIYYFTPSSTTKHVQAKAERMCERLWFVQRSYGQYTYNNNFQSSYMMTEVDYITNFEIGCVGLPAGSQIIVCGRKVLNID